MEKGTRIVGEWIFSSCRTAAADRGRPRPFSDIPCTLL